MTLTIKGSQINSLDDFYREIEPFIKAGECPWGRNLESLYEIVICHFNYTENPELDVKEIIWMDADLSQSVLGFEETKKYLKVNLAGTINESHQLSLERKLKLLETGYQETLFETITDILASNKDITLHLQ